MSTTTTTTTMKAWVQSEAGDTAEKNKFTEGFAHPGNPGPDQVLVRVVSAGVNPIDYKVTLPPFAQNIEFSKGFIGGCDGAGIVEEVGENVKHVKKGDAVFCHTGIFSGRGFYGEFALADAAGVEKFDAAASGWNLVDSGTVGCALWTATQALFFACELTKDDVVFINGGSGGVGVFALQLARETGARIITTCSTRNVDFVKSLIGPNDVVIDYTKVDGGDVGAAVKAASPGGKGVSAILDTVSDYEASSKLILGAAAFNCRVAVLLPVAVPAPAFFGLNIHISFVFWGGLLGAKPDLARRIIEKARSIVNKGKIKIPIAAENRFKFEQLNDALALSKTGRTQGKAVVVVNEELAEKSAAGAPALSSLPHSKCSKCNHLCITEHVFDASNGSVVEMAVCVYGDGPSHPPTALDVSSSASTTLPPIPPTATCVAVTELNSKAAAWIATSSNIRTVCIVGSARIDPTLPLPLPQVQRLLVLNKYLCGFTLQLADADRFAATFPNLLELSAQGVVTDGTLASLSKCGKLQALGCIWCKDITDAGLQHLAGLRALKSLIFYTGEQITDAGLQHLTSGLTNTLQSLNLHDCKLISDAGLQHLSGLTALQSLNLYSCEQISDVGLSHLRGLTAMRELDLSYCREISDSGLQHLRGMAGLQQLDLGHCGRISDAGLQHLSGLTALQKLNLHDSTQIGDVGLQHLAGLTAMRDLDLGICRAITDAGLQHLRGMTGLQSLCLTRCAKITDAGLQLLGSTLTALRDLVLRDCSSVTDAGLQHLGSLTALHSLSLHNCTKITDAGLQHLRGLSALQSLGLHNCVKVTDAGKQALKAAIPNLSILV